MLVIVTPRYLALESLLDSMIRDKNVEMGKGQCFASDDDHEMTSCIHLEALKAICVYTHRDKESRSCCSMPKHGCIIGCIDDSIQ